MGAVKFKYNNIYRITLRVLENSIAIFWQKRIRENRDKKTEGV